jgi:CubicO group peptidase (beta-lactamase class C family)
MRTIRLTHRLLAAALLSGVSAAPSLASDAKIEAAADAYLRPLVDLDLFQGVILVARGDEVLLEKGYGFANLELQVLNAPGQVFRIASLSKPFTEVALGRLVEEKRLDLAAPLSRYVPGFPNGDRITIDMLRNHQAGIPNLNSIPFDEEARQPNTLDSLVRVLAATPLVFEPGSKTRYSNGNYAVLGHVIERVTGVSYGDYLERAVLQPLGLAHTRHESDQVVIPGRAYGYTVSPDQRGVMIVAPFQEMATKTGGGSLVSSAGDLRRFLRAMHRDNVLQADTWRLLFPPDSVFTYQGRCPGFNVFMTRDFSRDVIVVVLSNNYASGMVRDIGNDLATLARGGQIANPRWRSDVKLDSTRAARLVGTYRPAAGALPQGDGPFGIRWHKGALVLFLDRAPVDVLIPQGDDAFLLRNFWSELRFVTADAGKAPKATMRPLWFQGDPVPMERVAK